MPWPPRAQPIDRLLGQQGLPISEEPNATIGMSNAEGVNLIKALLRPATRTYVEWGTTGWVPRQRSAPHAAAAKPVVRPFAASHSTIARLLPRVSANGDLRRASVVYRPVVPPRQDGGAQSWPFALGRAGSSHHEGVFDLPIYRARLSRTSAGFTRPPARRQRGLIRQAGPARRSTAILLVVRPPCPASLDLLPTRNRFVPSRRHHTGVSALPIRRRRAAQHGSGA